ncbi:MAG: sulfatase-like hydrolase/transferase [Chromatiales bacterium]|nr:sulfatase-like hydrolase/transferase [Chromatiales bacterium]
MLQRLGQFALSLLILFSVALLAKGLFALFQSELHQGMGSVELIATLLWGFRFDLAISAILALLGYLTAQLFALIPRVTFVTALRWTTALSAVALILLHGSDAIYYVESGRHLGYELKEGWNSGTELFLTAVQAHLSVIIVHIILALTIYYAVVTLFARFTGPDETSRSKVMKGGAVLPVILISVILIRGGVQPTPLEPLHAQKLGDTAKAALALNGVYNAIFSTLSTGAISPVFADNPSRTQIELVGKMYPADPAERVSQPIKRNVVVILLESWSGAYMAPYGHHLVTTPYFDQFREEGLTTRAMLAGGHRTTEGMFATFCSAQNPLGQTVAQSQLQNYNYLCLPKLLSSAGWSSAFFQGTNKETSGTGAFAQLLGFKESYGKLDISQGSPQLEQNQWGYHDQDIYRFTINKMREMPQPFLIGINTNTTHALQMPEGVSPFVEPNSRLNEYQNVLHFADQSLHDFIIEVQKAPEFKDTLFVLVADHTGLSPKESFSKSLVPFAILAPDIAPVSLDIIAHQRDIAPTVLQMLNLPSPTHFSGKSLLTMGEDQRFADYYDQGVLGWVEGERAIEFPVTAPETPTCLSLAEKLNSSQPVECDSEAIAMQQRALAFTRLSQSLLFSGNLSLFPTPKLSAP